MLNCLLIANQMWKHKDQKNQVQDSPIYQYIEANQIQELEYHMSSLIYISLHKLTCYKS